ncbi:hypothetical protein BZA77DRAFT_305499 [Pyronema omphalodes]|nr:hypothetical protein BZA77DRAFT_305499 [Pyronema omphalodes]
MSFFSMANLIGSLLTPVAPSRPATPMEALLLLSRLLPREIALCIVDAAELWNSSKDSLSQSVAISQYSSHEPYVKLEIKNKKKLRRIIFKMNSHDQGWSSDNRRFVGTYEASWTWFEVGIMGKKSVENKIIQYNVHAKREPTYHEVVWERDEPWLKDNVDTGDVIALYPMARYPGWVNHVLSAEIEAFYEAL